MKQLASDPFSRPSLALLGAEPFRRDGTRFPQAHKTQDLVQTVKATGRIAFDCGQFWLKGQSMGTGHANVKYYNRQLSRLIEHDKAKPSWLVSHELALTDAPRAYASFDQRETGWTKVVLRPGK